MQISESVHALARIVRDALAPGTLPAAIDPALVDFAIARHRVGPLIWAAVQRSGQGADKDAQDRLSRHATANARRAAIAGLVQARLTISLARAGVPSLVFKGLPMARQLYPQPYWRHSGDVDLLVRPEDFVTAATCLAEAGIVPSGPSLSRRGTLAGLSAKFLRDIALYDPTSGQRIELHQRLIFSRSLSAAILARDATFRPRLPGSDGEIPAPAVGAGLSLYLFMHGAMSAWWRLKWLTDLFALLPQLSAQDARALADTAEDIGMAASAKAALILLRAVFGEYPAGPLDDWIGEAAGTASVTRRLNYCAAMLNEPSAAAPNPAHSRFESLKCSLLLAERLPQRLDILCRGPVASALRFTERLVHGEG